MAAVREEWGTGLSESDPSSRGLFAAVQVKQGEVVFDEKPIVCVQSNRFECLSCDNCLKFTGTLRSQAEVACGVGEPKDVDFEQEDLIVCPMGCGVVFCSSSCWDEATKNGHWMLCTGMCQDMSHPLAQFKVHAVQNFERLLLAGKAFARILAVAIEEDQSSVKSLWDDIFSIIAPRSETEMGWEPPFITEKSNFDLRKVCEESVSLLRAAFIANEDIAKKHEEVNDLVTLDNLGQMLAKFQINNIGIRIESPLVAAVQNEERMSNPDGQFNRDWLESLVKKIEELDEGDDCDDCEDCEDCEGSEGENEAGICKADESGDDGEESSKNDEDDQLDIVNDIVQHPEMYFHPVDGEGVFKVALVMNHSCDPNIHLQFNKGDYTIQAVALRDIEIGEELTHDYVRYAGEESGGESRRKLLQMYAIDCDCSRCQAKSSSSTSPSSKSSS